MDASVCAPQADNNSITTAPNAASLRDACKVINTNIDSAQNEVSSATTGDSEQELLKGLLTDDYCHVCEAILLFESQRQAHYEGKKHAQKVRLYLQTKRAERMNKDSVGVMMMRTLATDKDRFCELCNMVFSSHVVARSHYDGKVHAKNLRKQGLQPPDSPFPKNLEMTAPSALTQVADQKFARDAAEPQDPVATTTSTSEVDLKDPGKYCAMCAASFNNPQMAMQHYNGRKHQRNKARQDLLKELGEDAEQANSLMCQICSVQFCSVEMFQAHMQGNKHQTKEKKVSDLHKSQPKVYNSYDDELANYIRVQKARGLIPKTNVPLGDRHKEGEEGGEEDEGGFLQPTNLRPILPPGILPPLPLLHPGTNYPGGATWCPQYPGPLTKYSYRGESFPPDAQVTGHWSPGLTRPRRRRRERSSSSSSYTSSSSSSSSSSSYSSSSTSDSEDRRHQKRKRRMMMMRKRRGAREEGSAEEERRRRQRWKRVRGDGDSEERRGRGEEAQSEGEERRRRKRERQKDGREKDRNPSKRRRPEEERLRGVEGEGEEERVDKAAEVEIADEVAEEKDGSGLLASTAESAVDHSEREQAKTFKPKHKKEKRKGKVDTRTEEEKLWDESILGL